MKRLISILSFILLSVTVGVVNVASAATAEETLKSAAAKIKNAGGISASFTMTSGNHKVSGTLKSSGSKFALNTPGHCTWYDGKSMWTYNSGSGETTVMSPTAAEVAEANPLALIYSYSASFTSAFAKSQKAGQKTIVLTPKSKSLGFKSVHVSISDATGLPVSVVLVPQSGARIDVSISSLKTNQKFSASDFIYPKSKYPKAEIVDLR